MASLPNFSRQGNHQGWLLPEWTIYFLVVPKEFLKKRKKDFPDIEIKEIQQLPDGKQLLVITIKASAKNP